MKVRVIAERCVGHSMCWLAAPTIFQLSDEDGHASVTSDDVPPDLEEAVRQAERGCPEEAIEILDEIDARAGMTGAQPSASKRHEGSEYD